MQDKTTLWRELETKMKFWFGPRLVDAAAVGDVETIRRLLKTDSPNAQNQLGSSALSVACQYNQASAAKVLLDHSETDPNIADLNGETALMKACEEGHTPVVSLLLGDKKRKLKIRPEMQDKDGWTALFFVKNLGISKKLMKRMDADALNLRDKDGDTAFMVHVGKGRIKIVEAMLKQKGLELRYRNKRGQTALDIAKKKERRKLVTLLEKQMKKRYGSFSPLLSPRTLPCRSPTMSPTRSPLKMLGSPFASLPTPPDLELSRLPSRTPSLVAKDDTEDCQAEKPKWPVVVIKVKEDKKAIDAPIKLGKPNIARLRKNEPLHWDAHESADEFESENEELKNVDADLVVAPDLGEADDDEEVDYVAELKAAKKKKHKKASKKSRASQPPPAIFLPPSITLPPQTVAVA